MTKYFKIITLFICIVVINPIVIRAQQVIQNNGFTYIPTLNNEAVMLTEIPLKNTSMASQNYSKLKTWVKENYTTDLINSSIMYYQDDDAILVKSKVELLLPILNNINISEKAILTYQLYAFIDNNKCVFQITNMEYKIINAIPNLKQKVKAEDFVTDNILKMKNQYSREQVETQKSTLFFFNELVKSLDSTLNP